jgi:hypothetical protein
MELEHIIIQAGGKGSRLGPLTKNKPKGIVPINNTPMIFSLFNQFPRKKFIVIGDYLFDVLEQYLRAFAPVKHLLVRAGGSGTCGGIGQAVRMIPDGAPVMLVWSDLILPDGIAARLAEIGAAGGGETRRSGEPALSEPNGYKPIGRGPNDCGDQQGGNTGGAGASDGAGGIGANGGNAGGAGAGACGGINGAGASDCGGSISGGDSGAASGAENYIGISKDFPCRWSYEDGRFCEKTSSEHGVAGLFIFRDKSWLEGAPESGEFVRWLGQRDMKFAEIGLWGAKEVGTPEAYAAEENREYRCRPFNELSIEADRVVKTFRGEQGAALAKREKAWYREAAARGFGRVPRIMSYDPLTMERICGQNIFRKSRADAEKRVLIDRIVDSLSELHSLGRAPADQFSVHEAYCAKTLKRIDSVRAMIPFAQDRSVVINGKECRNVFHYRREFEDRLREKLFCGEFAFIHGDCTFSNIMADDALNVVFLDPRGYFGFTELFGDPCYDWAKLYYSIRGDYDQFNVKNFRLDVGGGRVELEIGTNGFRGLEAHYLGRLSELGEFAEFGKFGEPGGRGAAGGANGATGGGTGSAGGAAGGGRWAGADKIRLIHAIIWLSLTTYAWEDYDSICGAFYNGLYYLEDCL